jgi:hypothetical protein
MSRSELLWLQFLLQRADSLHIVPCLRPFSTTIHMNTQEADDGESPSDENMDQARKNWLSISLALGRRKKRKWVFFSWWAKPNYTTSACRSDALDPYRKFVAFYTRSENPFVNYYSVLDAGMAWETSQFGDLSKDAFVFILCFLYCLLILPKVPCRERETIACVLSTSC